MPKHFDSYFTGFVLTLCTIMLLALLTGVGIPYAWIWWLI